MKLLNKLGSFFDRLINSFAFLSAIILAFVTLLVSTDVTMRYFWNKPIIWSSEISEVCLLYIAFLGIAWVLKRNGHVSIDFVINRIGPRAKLIFNIISSFAGMIVSVVLFYYGALTTWDHFQRGVFESTAVGIPNVYILTAIPVGSFLFFVQFIRQTYGYFCELKSPHAEKGGMAKANLTE